MAVAMNIRLITTEDVRLMETQNKLIEVSNGIWEEPEMASPLHGRIGMRLGARILTFVETNDLGAVYGADTTYVLEGQPNNIITMRLPEVSFVAKERVQDILDDYYYLVPDIAVEIISQSERPGKIAKKLSEYQRAGVRQIWQVYPESQEVIVYEGKNIRVYGIEDTLDGGEVLPGFELLIRHIFD